VLHPAIFATLAMGIQLSGPSPLLGRHR